jgi:hypothetical protein
MAQDDEIIQTVFRIPKWLHTKVHAAADGVHSANAEMIQRLAKSFEADEALEKRLTAIERVLARVEKLLK